MSRRYQPSLIDQTSHQPVRKVKAAALVGTPTAAVVAYGLTAWLNIEVNEEIAAALLAALGSLVAAITAYLARNRASEF